MSRLTPPTFLPEKCSSDLHCLILCKVNDGLQFSCRHMREKKGVSASVVVGLRSASRMAIPLLARVPPKMKNLAVTHDVTAAAVQGCEKHQQIPLGEKWSHKNINKGRFFEISLKKSHYSNLFHICLHRRPCCRCRRPHKHTHTSSRLETKSFPTSNTSLVRLSLNKGNTLLHV